MRTRQTTTQALQMTANSTTAISTARATHPASPAAKAVARVVAPVAALLIYEQSLVKANDLSKVNMAFFTVNGFLGLAYFAAMAIEVYRNV